MCFLGVTCVLVGGVVLKTRAQAPSVDRWWNNTVASIHSPVLEHASRLLDIAGAGVIGFVALPLTFALGLVLSNRRHEAGGLVVLTALSYGLVQAVKHLVDRPRPHDIATISDLGSYPSGHVANAATMAVFLALVYQRSWLWTLAALYVILMALSRTFLHAHWLSDTVAASLLGAALATLAWTVTTSRETRTACAAILDEGRALSEARPAPDAETGQRSQIPQKVPPAMSRRWRRNLFHR